MDGQMMYRAYWLERVDVLDGVSYWVESGVLVTIDGERFVRTTNVMHKCDESWHDSEAKALAAVAAWAMRLAVALVDQANKLLRVPHPSEVAA